MDRSNRPSAYSSGRISSNGNIPVRECGHICYSRSSCPRWCSRNQRSIFNGVGPGFESSYCLFIFARGLLRTYLGSCIMDLSPRALPKSAAQQSCRTLDVCQLGIQVSIFEPCCHPSTNPLRQLCSRLLRPTRLCQYHLEDIHIVRRLLRPHDHPRLFPFPRNRRKTTGRSDGDIRRSKWTKMDWHTGVENKKLYLHRGKDGARRGTGKSTLEFVRKTRKHFYGAKSVKCQRFDLPQCTKSESVLGGRLDLRETICDTPYPGFNLHQFNTIFAQAMFICPYYPLVRMENVVAQLDRS